MSELREHSGYWEAAFNGLSVPPAPEAWASMESLLDREMPTRRRDRRALWLLLGLLLLLIGVCNRCHDHRRTPTAPGTGSVPSAPAGHAAASVPAGATAPIIPGGNIAAATPRGNTVNPAPGAGATNTDTAYTDAADSTTAGRPDTVRTKASNPHGKFTKPGTVTAKTDTAVRKPHKSDSTNLKKPKPRTDQHGWLVGAGVNQFLPVGDESFSNYNSGGTTGGLLDYLPVPVVRYYFHTYMYVQMEAQVDAPQYTGILPVASDSVPNALVPGGAPTVNQVTVRKLFYFNLPVSVHYSPVKGLFVGTGMQFSHLTNAVGQQNVIRLAYRNGSQIYDTTTTYGKVITLKNTTAYRKFHTDEWRFLFDVNYQWKILTLGVQYNQALSPFIRVPVGDYRITQYRNSSLQLYFRVALWRRMKTKQLPPKQR